MRKYKIMMVTMGLGIGGAETHIMELSKELSRQGNDVIVCSSGGKYAETLKAQNIPHFDMPLNVRGFKQMSVSFFALIKIIKKERPDIVHAHARIPALIAGIACNLLGIPMVTTVHGKFVVTPVLRLFTRWGKHSLTVSQDLKNYLMESYHTPAKQITLTVNGINTDTFRPNRETETLRQELAIAPEKKVIIYISRMDVEVCGGAYRLLNCAEALYAARPDTILLLVGGGNAYEDVKVKAESINQKLGVRYVLTTGGRIDIYRFCALADVFVGISRAAMEAMACEKPVILAGADTFLGLYTPDKLVDCIRTNFTCRGIPYPNDDVLQREILFALETPPAPDLLQSERTLISSQFSVGKMATDALSVYRMVLTKKRWDVLLCGYYGYNNIGDEYALRAIIKNLQTLRPNIRICVLTNCPEVVANSLGVPCADRFSIGAVLETIRGSRVMIFGGGNLLQDATSSKSLWYYLMLLRSAKRQKLPTMIYANGIGPIRRKMNLYLTKRVLHDIDFITLRENDSYELVRSMGIPDEKLKITADEAFTIELEPQNSDLIERYGLKEGKYLVVSIRESPACEPQFEKKLGEALNKIARRHQLVTVFMQMQYPYDYKISKAVAAHMTTPVKILSDLNFNDFSCLLHSALLVVGMRLHSLILGVLAGATVYGLVYDDKVESFLKAANIHLYSMSNNLSEDKLFSDMESVLENAPDVRARMSAFTNIQREKAFQNSEAAITLLYRTEQQEG